MNSILPHRHVRLVCLLALTFWLGACHKSDTTSLAGSGLQANTTYYCDTVVPIGEPRLFVSSGEITNGAVIEQYLTNHPYLLGQETVGGLHPSNMFATPSNLVYYNGLVPYSVTVQGDSIFFSQQDTTRITHTNNPATAEFYFQSEQRFRSVLSSLLDMHNSYTSVERLAPESYRLSESLNLKGSYQNGQVVLPYTFLAMGFVTKSYPLPVLAAPALNIQQGDTLLVQQGTVTFHAH